MSLIEVSGVVRHAGERLWEGPARGDSRSLGQKEDGVPVAVTFSTLWRQALRALEDLPMPGPATPCGPGCDAISSTRAGGSPVATLFQSSAGDAQGVRVQLLIGADPGELSTVRSRIRAIAVESGFSERAGDLALAMDELVANAQEHGLPPIEITAWVDGRLIVEVCDHGGGFDHAKVWKSHPPPPSGRRGRGLWIVRQLVDVVSIRREDERNIVRIEVTVDPGIGA